MRSKTLHLASLLTIVFLVLLVAATLATRGTRASPGYLYVSTDGFCGENIPCYSNVQDALNAALPFDEILVATGTYTDTAGTVAEITETITLQGGWNADFTARDPEAYPTTLDAQGNGRVVQVTGTISPTIDGFIITGGNAHSEATWSGRGGGIFSFNASPIIQNNVITNNIAYMGTTPSGYGGGIYMSHASASSVISGNTIVSNTACTEYYGWGGGLSIWHGGARVMGNEIINNAGNRGGGGIHLRQSYGVTFSGNNIIHNTTSDSADGYGGAFSIELTDPFTLTNNIIAQNYAYTVGGGMYVLGSDDPYASSGHLVNNTFAGNDLGSGGQGIYATGVTTLTLTNNIVVSHTYGIYAASDSTVTADYTLFVGNTYDTAGPGTITSTNEVIGDPFFVNPSGWDYHIQVGSAAIDAGTAVPWLTTDIDGDPRPLGTLYDIGADESPIWYIYLPLIMKNQ